MVGRAQSTAEKKHIHALRKEEGLAYAIKLHGEDQEKPEKERRSLRVLCQDAEEEMKRRKKAIHINHVTLKNRLEGRRSCQQANEENNAWLTPEEEENVVAYCIELAARGFPLTHKTLKFHVDTLLRARLGSMFPEHGVGKNWTGRFITRHLKSLGTHWSSSLDAKRGQAVNENTHKAWFTLLKSTLDKYQIEEDCIWAADETGFQPGVGQKQRVLGPAKQKMQYQQRDGNKETITVMVTVCADGSTIPPTCIYKGQSFSTNWHQDDTLRASVAHSDKGWTDGTIGKLWIEDFDQKTHEKANGRARLLLVDGHNSHYTKEFLDYAHEHDIHVLCYPAHTTHIYQGLDVVIFGPLKQSWSDEQDQFKSSTGQKVTKQNFISVYGKAHQKVLTPKLIRMAFATTGVWPFNPNIVTKEKMGPSLETSSKGCLPLPVPSPVRAVTSLIRQYQGIDAQHTPTTPRPFPLPSPNITSSCNDDPFCISTEHTRPQIQGQEPQAGPSTWTQQHQPATLSHMNWHASAAQETIGTLALTSASFLVDKTPLTSLHHLPDYTPITITPTRKRWHKLLEEEPQDEKEHAYQDALHESYNREEHYKSALFGMQSTVVLQSMYCDRVSSQLAAVEERRKKQKKGKLNADGLPKLLTGDAFRTLVTEHDIAAEKEKVERENRRKQREAQMELMVAWKEVDEARKQRNKDRREAYHEELHAWEEERDLAKQERRRIRWKRPKLGKLETAAQKPGAESVDFGRNDVQVGGNEDDDDGTQVDSGWSDED